MPWFQKLRLRVLAIAVAAALAVLAAVSFAAAPVLPAIGVAAVAVAFAVNTMAARLAQPACYGCGGSLKGIPGGLHGVLCPTCGLINDAPGAGRFEQLVDDEEA
ncbi:MAG: hypothetical protein ACF8R7_02405 [Phycisphaerales bacterium JB039]